MATRSERRLLLIVAPAIQRTLTRQRVAQIALAGVVFAACIGPMLANNLSRWGTWAWVWP